MREAENLKNIHDGIRRDGFATPLVADVHFNPRVADVAALYAEKVRVNPGNYVDPARKFIKKEYTDEEYAEELKKIEERFVPFLNICKEHHTAIRIGVNHGSLSDRIRNRYGDTPEGIVESCMEFLRICKKEHFDDVVISIKASNTVVMVRSVRLLVDQMDKEDMHYPLHLGSVKRVWRRLPRRPAASLPKAWRMRLSARSAAWARWSRSTERTPAAKAAKKALTRAGWVLFMVNDGWLLLFINGQSIVNRGECGCKVT